MPKPRKKKRNPKRHALYPEPGAWVVDDVNGLPKLQPPAPLSRQTLTTQEIRDEYVAYEGLGFCIYEYVPSNAIDDAKLRKLWADAKQAMRLVVDYLETAPEARKPRRRERIVERGVSYSPMVDVEAIDADELEETEL